jgi:hypothetical protein
VPLVRDQVASPVCEGKGIHLSFMSLSDINRHLDQHDSDARIQWGCLRGKSFPKLRGTQCHILKCSGTGQKKTEGEYQCEACPISFGTQRALSTHEKHAHPTLRNTKRRGTDPPSKNWKVEEISLLRKLEEEFKNYGYPNVEISKILTGRSMDQLNIRGENLNWPVRERALSRLIRRQREDAISLTQAIHD